MYDVKEEKELLRKRKKKVITWSVLGIVILISIIALCNMFTTVPTGHIGVITTFGEVSYTQMVEGLNTKVPFIQQIHLIDCRLQKCEYTMEASSKDLQIISNLKVAVNYNVSKESASQLYKTVGMDYKTILIEPAIYEAVKSTIANYTAEELITKRSEISALALEAFYNKVGDKGIQVVDLNILDLSFSPEFDAAIEKKQIVEQETKAAELELQKAKIENEKRIENAKADAEVMKQQNSQITDKTLELKKLEIQQSFINKWDGQLPSTMLNDGVSSLFNINN